MSRRMAGPFGVGIDRTGRVGHALLVALGLTTVPGVASAQDLRCPPAAAAAGSQLPFRITVDGQPRQRGDSVSRVDLLRCQDSALERAQLQVRADPRERTPVLNIAGPRTAVRQQTVDFRWYSNYPHWVVRPELRVLPSDGSSEAPPIAVVTTTDPSEPEFRWTVDVPEGLEQVRYVVRVYDREGRYDETAPRVLHIVDRDYAAADRDRADREALIGYGENHRAIANIPVQGVAVTVNGDRVDPRARVTVLGQVVPVGDNGRFAARQLLPAGTHAVTVSILAPDGTRQDHTRDVDVGEREWFHVALADFTLGKNSVDGPAALVTGRDTRRYRGESYLDGRLAFYLKGDIGAATTLTASADTREQPFGDLFSNFGARDPLALLRRLDANYAYPVYGDDGMLVEDAPTQGKFHLRLDRYDTRLMWGSFQTPVTGTDLVRFNRGLYGAEFRHRGLATTAYGERRTQATVFGADPGTVGARDEYHATGGSLYYLRYTDILLGSERVMVEVRDRESGLVLESSTLVPFQDYEVNALQGRVMLRSPLAAIAASRGLVRTGALSGDPVHLVVTYEYTPTAIKLDQFTTGGRLSHWFGDHVLVGLTGYHQDGTTLGQQLFSGDVTLRYRPGTYLTVERARSEGVGSGSMASIDGGYSFTPIETSATVGSDAGASRVELGINFAELREGPARGTLGAYWQNRANGFAAPGQFAMEGVSQGGGHLNLPLNDRLGLRAKADIREGSRSGSARSLELGGDLDLTETLRLQAGVRQEQRASGMFGGNSSLLSEVGDRTDMIGVLGYHPVDSLGAPRRYHLYALAQGTVRRDDGRTANDRYGVGGGLRVSDRVTLTSEVSDGTGGWGGKIASAYQVSDRSSLYLNYLMDTDRADQGVRGRTGNLAAGGRVRYSETSTLFAERRQQTSEHGPSGLMHAFGLDLAPTDRWNWGVKLEAGSVSEPTLGDIDRQSASLFAGYAADRFRWSGALEYRVEEGDTYGQRTSWLSRNAVGVQLDSGWRALGRANIALSTAPNHAIGLDANYTELVAGLAYRPLDGGRVNALFRYTYLYDQAAPGQLGAHNDFNPYAQRSHVLAADAVVRVTRLVSVGGKIGHRTGEIRDRSQDDAAWQRSGAWLAIARGDLHVVRQWDVIGEYRRLWVTESGDVRSGALVGVYRQIGGSLRLGVGYNFTNYSDDLTDMSYRSRGWFVNLLGTR